MLDPGSRILHRLDSQSATVNAAIDFAFEQARGFQNAHVFRDGRQRSAEGRCKLRDHGLTPCETGQNGAAGGIGESSKGGIQRRRRIVNHKV